MYGKDQRIKNGYTSKVRKLVTSRFEEPGNHDQFESDWDRWFQAKSNDPQIRNNKGSEIAALSLMVHGGKAPIRARALALLLAPTEQNFPFPWFKDRTVPLFSEGSGGWDLNSLSPDMIEFVGELLLLSIELCHAHTRQGAKGSYSPALNSYNYVIVRLLERLAPDHELAKRLFAAFQLNDPLARHYDGELEESSVYDPFGTLLRSSAPVIWKQQADLAMREIIVRETQGAPPRKEWEEALLCYAHQIFWPREDASDDDVALLQSQINFLTDTCAAIQRNVVTQFDLMKLYDLLPKKEQSKLRAKVLRTAFLASNQQRQFSFFYEEAEAFVAKVFAEFGKADEELLGVISAIKAAHDDELQRRAAAADAQRQAAADQRRALAESQSKLLE